VHAIRTSLHALLGVVIAVLLAAPAAAWDRHALAHISAPVSASEHHHHAADGTVEVGHHADVAPEGGSDEEDGGHDHLPSLAAATAGLLSDAPLIQPRVAAASTHSDLVARAPPDLPPEPQIRPPRSA
jgi:hypothetical protein